MWDKVELLLNEDTHTVRLCSDAEANALYQVDTLVKLSSSEKVPCHPQVCAFSFVNCCVVVVDTAVVVFDLAFQTVLIHLHFETLVDAVTVCPSGQFLLVCERSGSLHVIFVPLKKTVLTKTLRQKNSSNDDETTFKSLTMQEMPGSPGMYELFFILNDGVLHMSNLNLGEIEKAIENRSLQNLNEIQTNISTSFHLTKKIHEGGCVSASLCCSGATTHLLIGGYGSNTLSHWKMCKLQPSLSLTNFMDSSLSSGVKKIQVVNNLIYILNEEGMLSVLDLHTLVTLCCWPDQYIVDFLLILDRKSSSISSQETSMKILTLAAEKRKGRARKLMVQSLPSMEMFYSLDVAAESWLIQKGITMDTIYLLEGVFADPDSPEDPVSSLVIRCLTEALPENRLNKLLYKHKFEEAEKFAKAFQLDVELVYKVKLNAVLEELIMSTGSNQKLEWEQLIAEAKTNLTKIMDDDFVVQYSLTASWPTFSIAEEMLNYALNRFPSSQIQIALAKLATFGSLYGPSNFDSVTWLEFLNTSDYLKDIFVLLKDGNLSGAQFLWLRHEAEFADGFDGDSLHNLLASISSDIPSEGLVLWLKGVVVPFIQRVMPKEQNILIRWLEQRARNLELTEKIGWPHNGLALAELGLPSLWTSMGLTDDVGADDVEQLQSLVSNLRQLCDLYSKYNCPLSLSDFERRSTRSMAFLMLDKVQAPELIPAAITSSVRPYALENRLDLDQTLLHYIKDLLDSCNSQILSLFTEWEAKAVAILCCMTDTNKVMDGVIEIMHKAVVPWSDTIEKLVQKHLEKDHPKQELLKEGYRLMEVKKLLRCYGIISLEQSNSRYIMMVVRHILKQDLPTSLEDSLKLLEAYKLNPAEILHLHCIQLLQKNERERCISVVKSRPRAEVEYMLERMVYWARLELQDKRHVSDEHKKLQMDIAQFMVEALRFLQSIQTDDAFKETNCEEDLKMFTAIAHLQEDFDIFLTPEEYEDPAVRQKFNQQLITAYKNTQAWRRSGKPQPDEVSTPRSDCKASSDSDGKTKALSTEAGLHRLARQLQKTEQELWADLALRALDAGDVKTALEILDELYQHHPSSSTGHVLFSSAQRLCQMLEKNLPMVLPEKGNLPTLIHALACQAVTICRTDLLLDTLELCKNTRSAADVYRQCQIEELGFFTKESGFSGEEDTYDESIFQDTFKEDCIVLDPASVLPLQYKIITNVLSPAEFRPSPFGCSCLPYCGLKEDVDMVKPLLSLMGSMLQMLLECSQFELAFRLLIESYSSILQHYVSNNMNLSLSMKLHSSGRLAKDKQTLAAIEAKVLPSLSMVVVSLLQKVLNWRVVDSDLAIGLCTVLSQASAVEILWKTINNAWQNYDKIKAVAMVGARLSSLNKDEEERQKFMSVITDADWGNRLGKFGVSIQSVFRKCKEMKRNLIPTLVKNKIITPDILLQYCSTFGLDKDSAINLYITTLLLEDDHWYESDAAERNVEGSMPCEEGHQGHDYILDRALQAVPHLSSTKDLVISLNVTLTKLNPYNYEWIERVLKTIQMADESTSLLPLGQMMELLQHLKSHRRLSPPTDQESTYLLENCLEPSPLDKSRLPFHLLFQTNHTFWKIISLELSEDTLPTLHLICKLMKVNLDKLYVLAVNHLYKKSLLPLLMDQKLQNSGSRAETASVTQNIFKYVLSVQNLELAAATIHKIAQDLPVGAEKIDFLKFSLELVHNLLKSVEQSSQLQVEALLSKLQLQYQRSATENALLSSQLGSPELLKLTGLPDRLIAALFEHHSVLERMRSSIAHTYPDIHSVASEIANINSVDLLETRNILLEKWLCKTEQPYGKMTSAPEYVTDITDDPDLMRVVYLLQMHPMDMRARLLNSILSARKWPLGGSGLRLTFEHRSRTLLCLIHVADAATLKALSIQFSSDIKCYLKCFIFLAQLEALNIPYTLDTFISSPKEGMIKGLWKNHSNVPQAVRLVADLCLEYQVHDLQLWNSILQKLLTFNRISCVQKILEALIAVPSLLEGPCLSRIWRSVIQAPFLAASFPLSPQQEAVMYKTFVLLLKCPFLLILDLVAISKRFSQLSLQAFSLGTLLLIPSITKKEPQIQSFLLSCKPSLILDQVEDSMCTGELAGLPSQIRDTVFTFLYGNGKYHALVKTKHFSHMKRHLMVNERAEIVQELLTSLAGQNREKEAISFAQEYMKYRKLKGGESAFTNTSDPIKEFLEKAMESSSREKSI